MLKNPTEDIVTAGQWLSLPQPAETPRIHQEHEAPSGYVSNDWFALVHTPVPMSKVIKIPKAKKAVQDEWDKLSGLKAWLLDTVSEKADVIRKAKENKETVHFGSLMALCHQKHSELSEALRRYKGRVVFRGDNVRDEEGFYAVFRSREHQQVT